MDLSNVSDSNTATERRAGDQSTDEALAVNGPAVDESTVDGPNPEALSVEQSSGLRSRIPDPTYLALLFFLGIPGTLVPSLEWLENFYFFGLFGVWPMLSNFLPSPGSDESPTNWIRSGTRSRLRPLASMAYTQLNPFLLVQGLRQLAGHVPVLVRYRFRLPDPERFEQRVDYRLPVEGEWTVINGGPTRERSHSWGILAQRFAYDLVVTDDRGRTHDGNGARPAEYHCYDEPVVAPADGVVVAANDGHRDYHRTGGWLDPLQHDLRGNYLTIEHADGEYSVLAHLAEGSLTVSEGDRVERGERVARCGHSGNSTEPHLHFHVQDRPSFYRSMSLPIHFANLQVRGPDGEATTHERAYVHEGQRVAPAE